MGRISEKEALAHGNWTSASSEAMKNPGRKVAADSHRSDRTVRGPINGVIPRLDKDHRLATHANHLVDGSVGAGKVVEAFLAERDVKGFICEGKSFSVFRLIVFDQTFTFCDRESPVTDITE